MNTIFANSVAGEFAAGDLTRFANGALNARHRLVQPAGSARTVALCGANDLPLGVAQDDAEDAGAPINVTLLGSANRTLCAVAAANIAEGDLLVPAADGTVRKLPTASGTYHVIGRALQAASAGQPVGFDPCFPQARTV
ncbi:MAG: hypothetical protein E1N59_2278 [Puniceicoccaceae bacterium 5H]|nr:MAG: hypothetical protein E1N59_2278 [Puniceicoccaceae bacterium 5H]